VLPRAPVTTSACTVKVLAPHQALAAAFPSALDQAHAPLAISEDPPLPPAYQQLPPVPVPAPAAALPAAPAPAHVFAAPSSAPERLPVRTHARKGVKRRPERGD
jgi:hypothetical protein